MDLAYEIAQYLDNAGYGTLGTDILVGQISADTNGIYVIDGGGLPHEYTPIEETYLDIYCKDTNALECVTTLQSIKRFIHRMHTTETEDAYIFSMLVVGDVEDVSRDSEYAKIYKISVQILHRNTNLIS